ncbi:thermonuclease family protein [Melghirimyces algeriensis]|uniref:Endonuclease YncB, thermonuclease family n=1 Tax=Melghirimyces algeriensis TaxID=910412 RepID=A0A521AJB6_9BACL|nr:thermonuclease family protein [Melghirimyces algeriensis]SMO34770.1 Endonuclease YncB, thermonuclease family [Melghirimyces algeriensis]
MKNVLTLICIVAVTSGLLMGVAPDVHAKSYTATVESVSDGDTIRIRETIKGTNKIRLLSIDTPEMYYHGESQEPWATQAKTYLQQLLPPGTSITLETDVEETDDYGRLLAHVWKGNRNINHEMVRQGYAVTYFIWPNIQGITSFRSSLVEAKRNELQIWNASNPLPELPFEFRLRASGRQPEKYVGNVQTHTYVQPDAYQQVPVEDRIFFWSEADARQAGYTPADQNEGHILLNEVMPDPHTSFKHEFVELYNPGDQPVDISGYIIDDRVGGGSSPYTIPDGTVIPAKGYWIWEPDYYFNNAGDDVTLKSPDGTIIDQYSYQFSSNDASWYRSPDGGSWSETMDQTPTKKDRNQ